MYMLRLIVSRFLPDHGRITRKEAKSILSPYLARELSDSFISRTIKCSVEVDEGHSEDEVKNLPCVIAALQNYGWKENILTCDATSMRAQLLEVAKARHENQNRILPRVERVPFEVLTVPKVDDHSVFILEYTLVTPFVEQMHSLCHEFPVQTFHTANTKHYRVLWAHVMLLILIGV